jgi:hypothetical protein
MAAYLFQELAQLTADEFGMKFKSMKDLYTKEQGDPVARLRELAEEQTRVSPQKMLIDSERTKRLLPGRMYMMHYKPKDINKLPYYDRFPVFLCMNVHKEWFTGLNFHYLPPENRVELMDQLYPFVMAPEVKADDMARSLRVKLSPRVDYEFLKKRRSMMSFKPMWKRYRRDSVLGQFAYMPPIAWDIITMLPVQQFRKSSINRVWRESQIKRRKKN